MRSIDGEVVWSRTYRAGKFQFNVSIPRRRQLLSCGGGVIKRPENLRALRQNGVVLFIDRPLEDLAVGGGRPLSSSTDALKEMEAQRRPLYLAAADAVIPNKTTATDAVAAALEALDAIFVH